MWINSDLYRAYDYSGPFGVLLHGTYSKMKSIWNRPHFQVQSNSFQFSTQFNLIKERSGYLDFIFYIALLQISFV